MGKAFFKRKSPFALPSFFACSNDNTSVIGIIASVRVSLTVTALSSVWRTEVHQKRHDRWSCLFWSPVCGANLSRTFFPFSKRTVGLIDKCAGFWYDERMKRWICRCTLPIQGLLHGLDEQTMLRERLHLTYAGIISFSFSRLRIGKTDVQLHLTYSGITPTSHQEVDQKHKKSETP